MVLIGNQDPFVITLLIAMVISGSINTLDGKFQNQQFVQEGRITKYFYHPFMQTFCIYVATSFALPLLILQKIIYPQAYAKKLKQAQNQGIILISTIANIIANTFQLISLNFIPSSVYQMTRGGAIATTFIFSVLYLKSKPKKYQFIGSALAVLGVIVIGISNVIYSSSNSESRNSDFQLIGYLLLITSLFLSGFSYTFQQNLLRKYHIQPIQIVGYEGIFAIVIYSMVLACLTFTPCSFGQNACVYFKEKPYMERPDVYLKELGDHYPLLLTAILQIFSFFVFNISGISITKHINAVSRTICDVTRTLIIWTVGIIVTVTVGKNEVNYLWESTEAGAIGMQLTGFAVLVAGNFIYNKIMVLPCLPIDQQQIGEKKDYLSLDGNIQQIKQT